MRPLKLCWASSEFAPFAKAGGLADVSTALSAYLHGQGHDVRVFLPLYRRVVEAGLDLRPVEFIQDIPLKLGYWDFTYSLATAALPETGQRLYFVDMPHFYDRPGLYTGDGDEHLRFIFLCRAVISSCQHMGWGPDVFHCNDWQTALIPVYLKSVFGWDGLFQDSKTVLTIHNIGYQGAFPATHLSDTGLTEHAHMLHQDDLKAGVINFMKTGLLYADRITTVSRTYAREILGEEYGAGLQDVLTLRGEAVTGIVNGVDYGEWSPDRDAFIQHRYTAKNLAGKEKNKQNLLEQMGLSYEKGVPVVGLVSRLTWQKGLDLCVDALPRLLRTRDFRLVLLGSGEPAYVKFLLRLQQAFPDKVSFFEGFSNPLAHLIEAGSDIFLMPSLYEPCGLNQMYSLRYGTIPVVRRTGGLADTVDIYDPATGEGTGFVFDHYTVEGLVWALGAALDTYDDRRAWRKLQRNAMSRDFSWEHQGREYLQFYAELLDLEHEEG